jgi:hypothetical protein
MISINSPELQAEARTAITMSPHVFWLAVSRKQFHIPIDRATALVWGKTAVGIARGKNPGCDRDLVAAIVKFTIASQSSKLTRRLAVACERTINS